MEADYAAASITRFTVIHSGERKMSMTDLHHLAAKLHDLQENTKGHVESEKLRLLADVVLRMVHELHTLEERLSRLEKQ
jgi:hypothetical protein